MSVIYNLFLALMHDCLIFNSGLAKHQLRTSHESGIKLTSDEKMFSIIFYSPNSNTILKTTNPSMPGRKIVLTGLINAVKV